MSPEPVEPAGEVRGRAAWAALRRRAAEAVRREVARIPGVVEVTEVGVKGRGLGRDSNILEEPRLRVTLGVVVQYGPELPDIVAEARESAARSAEAATGCLVGAVEVLVADLYVPGEAPEFGGPSARSLRGARIDF